MENISMFDMMYPDYKIDKPIRLIELFAGVGSQAMALRNIGANFEHYKISEWEVSATASYKAIHVENDNTDYSLEIEIAKLPKILFDYGISKDGKEPMTLEEIERKGEKWQRITYNNLRATNNLGSICNFKGEDLEIVNTDSFTYLLTYSFPCQDLSVAGKRKGMAKGSGTRSGLLWEVERLLNEVEELPQVLLMENVPQVIGKKNIDNFQLWQQFLEDKGYSNFLKILNAKDYGVAQNRERCFMVSILGEWNYNFPKPIPLTKTMKDYLEDEVDEKYYIKSEKAQKLIQQLVDSKQLKNDTECVDGSVNDPKTKEISNCIKARYDAGISNFKSDGGMVVEVKVIGQMDNTIDHTFESANRVYDKEGLSPTINTCGGGDRQPKIVEPVIVASRERNPDNPSDRKQGIELEQRLEPNSEEICNTLTSVQKDNLVLEPAILTPKRTDYGKAIRKDYENGKIQESRHNMTELRPREDGVSNTLTTVQKDNLLLTPNNWKHKAGDGTKTRSRRISEIHPALQANTGASQQTYLAETPYRIRKLTPKECWRLMGFTDEDFYKAEQVNSNTQLYKQAGNSIVVKVLEAIFKQML